MPLIKGKQKFFEQIADKEIQDREEEQLTILQENIREIRKLLDEIKERQASTRCLVDGYKSQDYDLDKVYERARKWRHDRDDWSRTYTPTPPPPSTVVPTEKSFLDELEEAGDTMDPIVEEDDDGAETAETVAETVEEEEAAEETENVEETNDETAEAAADDDADDDEEDS